MVLAPNTSDAVAQFAARVRGRFGCRLQQLTLFGSHARGEATEESDVDILVAIDDLTSTDAREIDAIVGDLLTSTDVLLSPLVLSSKRIDELRARERRLVAEIDRDGIAV